MVLRYKALVAVALAVFALIWLYQVEFFPLSTIPMYENAVTGSEFHYLNVLDAQGQIINDNDAFFVAIYHSGDEIAGKDCFGGRAAVCHDYFTLIADWLQQDITVEHWRWDYKTGERSVVATVPIACDCDATPDAVKRPTPEILPQRAQMF